MQHIFARELYYSYVEGKGLENAKMLQLIDTLLISKYEC